jgi:hypothetical protein
MRLRRGAAQKACGSKMLYVFTGGRSDNAYGCEVQRLGWFAAIGLLALNGTSGLGFGLYWRSSPQVFASI